MAWWWWTMLGVVGGAAVALVALKAYIKLTTGVCRCRGRLDGRVAVVTGANTGIGYEAGAELARRGARVLLACRNASRGEEAAAKMRRDTGSDQVRFVQLDLASLASVRRCAAEILAAEPRLHILVNNAGAGGLGDALSEDGLHLGLQVNHFAPFLLTSLVLPRLVESARLEGVPSHVVMVAAWGHKMARPVLDDINMQAEGRGSDALVYCNSKLYNVVTACELARRLPPDLLLANSTHPGIVLTEIFRNMAAWARVPIHAIIKLFLKSAREGAQTAVHLAASQRLAPRSGLYWVDCKPASMAPLAQDAAFCRRVWDLSEACVKLQPKESFFNSYEPQPSTNNQ